ncbi:MAG: hypothetical protein RIQ89_510 [Bacteroidota bacterium]|jgi:uncharacterized protein involved in exopolysaccharide biosynthesis
MLEVKQHFEQLELKIQQLIQLNESNKDIVQQLQQVLAERDSQIEKLTQEAAAMNDKMKQLNEITKELNNEQIDKIKQKIKGIISEVDKSVALIKNKK